MTLDSGSDIACVGAFSTGVVLLSVHAYKIPPSITDQHKIDLNPLLLVMQRME